MEICGGQTHAIARYRLEDMLPDSIRLLHGPGCPVCVTSEHLIDFAIQLAMRPNHIIASFGDMMRVPGSSNDLLYAKAAGADIRILYSPLDAVQLATDHPEREVIFLAVGFETTIPVHLAALNEAIRRKLKNFSLLSSFYAVPPAIECILSEPDCRVNGFLTAGHVCAITGNEAYYPLARMYKVPMIVTGFEPVDLLYGIYRCIVQLESGSYEVENAYKRIVKEDGNRNARILMEKMLEPCDQEWRGIGTIPLSGYKLNHTYIIYDAEKRFGFSTDSYRYKERHAGSSRICIAGEIMRGLKQPAACPHFGNDCVPLHPIGAPMVSSEGACSAYYKYR